MPALSPKAGANIQRLFRVHTIQIKKNNIFFYPITQPPILQALTTLKKSKILRKASAKGLKKEIIRKLNSRKRRGRLFKEVPNQSKAHYKIPKRVPGSYIIVISGNGGVKMLCLEVNTRLLHLAVHEEVYQWVAP